MTGLLIVLGLAVVLVLAYVALYNGLVARKNQVDNAFGSIEAMLKKRYDLIPNLVAAVKQYMAHEANLLERVVALRSQAMGAPSPEAKFKAEGELSAALRGLMVQVENYPDLKANQNVLQLQAALNEAEEQISAARRFYNSAVTDYNNAIEMFPSSLIAQSMRLERKPVFTIPEGERAAPNVGQLFGN
ncbi:LemA family protein [Calidithermus chliarophilus]|uniref:LemA family protein n=1 Tax=Calidithermus chliarophilus TaxID=52023 RepID=UPI000419BC73|nr:LemA family protein [Calidithermus chliarophilus]